MAIVHCARPEVRYKCKSVVEGKWATDVVLVARGVI